MKEQIKQYIANNKVTDFLDIYNNHKETLTKPDLKTIINELEAEKIIVSAFNKIYETTDLVKHEGFVQWSVNGFCWVDSQNNSNAFGVNFNIPENVTTIFNKKSTPINVHAKGVLIEENERQYFFAQEISPQTDYQSIYYVDKENQCYQLNNSIKTKITVKDANNEINSINIANVKDEIYSHASNVGLLSESGIESKISFLLGELKLAPTNDSKEDSNSLEYKDYTKQNFFTIDGKYTKDIDDGISFKSSSTGYTLLVAIADVSHYVLPETKLDVHAQNAATSFYLPHQTVHMLSRELAEKDCSLNPSEIKRTMVCKMKFDFDGNLKTYKFIPAFILSHARLTYDDVDLILDNKEPLESTFYEDKKHFNKIKKSLISLNAFRQLMPLSGNKTSWIYNKPDYLLNENGKISNLIEPEVQTNSQQMVEFSMLHANICAGKELYSHYPEIGLFRNQTTPLDIKKPKAAVYSSNNDGHWGLSAEVYTHFTSPIRRYCDLVVHRLLKEILLGKLRNHEVNKLTSIASIINTQQTKGKHLDLKSRNILMQEYVEDLFNNKTLGKTMTIVDYNENGLIAHNKQKIEYFLPLFKLTRELADKTSAVPENLEDKAIVIKEINNDYKILGFVDYFSWLDDRKNVSYLIKPKYVKELESNSETVKSPKI